MRLIMMEQLTLVKADFCIIQFFYNIYSANSASYIQMKYNDTMHDFICNS